MPRNKPVRFRVLSQRDATHVRWSGSHIHARPGAGSEQSPLGKRDFRATPDHQMIEHPDIDLLQERLEVASEFNVTRRGLRHTRRVIVGDYHFPCLRRSQCVQG